MTLERAADPYRDTDVIDSRAPRFNQAVVGIVSALCERLEALGRGYEVLVVDNASEDGTVQAIQPLLDGAAIRLLRNEVNRGKGFSVRRGMLDARGELRLLCDADCGSRSPC